MNKPWVDIVIGSKSDGGYVEGATKVFEACDVDFAVSVISAHRHEEKLTKHCQQVIAQGASSVIAGAGWSAALPGAIAAKIKFSLQVFGVAIPSNEFPSAMDAMLSISRMPGGCPVLFAGIGKAGFENVALSACQGIAAGGDILADSIKEKVAAYIRDRAGEPVDALEEKQEKKEE